MRIPIEIVRVPKLWPSWVKARVSNRTIYLVEGVQLSPQFLAHELRHIVQREHLGPRFLFAYLWGWVRAWFRYHKNPLELEAHAAERDPVYLSWAEDILMEIDHG